MMTDEPDTRHENRNSELLNGSRPDVDARLLYDIEHATLKEDAVECDDDPLDGERAITVVEICVSVQQEHNTSTSS